MGVWVHSTRRMDWGHKFKSVMLFWGNDVKVVGERLFACNGGAAYCCRVCVGVWVVISSTSERLALERCINVFIGLSLLKAYTSKLVSLIAISPCIYSTQRTATLNYSSISQQIACGD